MKFKIKITQMLEGYAEIEADTAADALTAATNHFQRDGAALPDMEDCYPLHFQVAPEKVQEKELSGEEKVIAYLKSQGYPHPETDGTLHDFMNGGDMQWMFDEAVENRYDLCDVDRWIHLVQLLDKPVSFRAAMMVEDALWSEDLELLEINSPKEVLDTEKSICKNRIAFLVDVFSKDGTIEPNEFDVTDQDLVTLATALDISLSAPVKQKPHLSSLIESADAKSASQTSKAPVIFIPKEPTL